MHAERGAVARRDRTGEGDACKKKVGAFERQADACRGGQVHEGDDVCMQEDWVGARRIRQVHEEGGKVRSGTGPVHAGRYQEHEE